MGQPEITEAAQRLSELALYVQFNFPMPKDHVTRELSPNILPVTNYSTSMLLMHKIKDVLDHVKNPATLHALQQLWIQAYADGAITSLTARTVLGYIASHPRISETTCLELIDNTPLPEVCDVVAANPNISKRVRVLAAL